MRKRPTRKSMALWLAVLVTATVLGAAAEATAQTPYMPYYGKNLVRYDRFDWQIYKTEHFEIYYYPSIEQHLERVAGYAESAYQQISAELKHDLAFKVPLIIFKTHSEFEQQNVIPGAATEGVGAFAEPYRDRMLLPLDDPPDLLYRLIVHELTHIFEFDIVPQSLIRETVPLWVAEGLSDYMTGIWRPVDLMTVRDAAVTDMIPKMSKLEGYGQTSNPRLVYNLGHAAFEFIESKWGKEGLRQFLFSLRKGIVGGAESAYLEAFQLSGEDFDQQFDRYLKARFKPFRDKETPSDYGRNLAPNPEKGRFDGAIMIEPSPSGDLLAVVTINRRDREIDIVLISAKDGKVIRNLTPGFDQGMGFDYIVTPGNRWITIPWLAWSPAGDRLAYVVRREKGKAIVIQNVLNKKIEKRIDLKTVDEPESPAFSPDGKVMAFSAMKDGWSDIFTVDLATEAVTNLTKDEIANYAPAFSPDGKSVVYLARISGNEKLFKLDLDSGKKTQLTFGTHDDAAARFLDADTLIFASTATDPNKPVEPEVARNGQVFNIWTLGLKTGELKQFTDAVGGNFSPVILRDESTTRIAFITYYKGDYELHAVEKKDAIVTAATADFGAPGPMIDFQAPLNHTLISENKVKKGSWDKMFLDGRPPLNVGVTSGGNFFGSTAVSFTDVLGDRRVDAYFGSMSQYPRLGRVDDQPGAPLQLRDPGLLAGRVLLRVREHLLRSDLLTVHRPRPRDVDAEQPRRVGVRDLSTEPLPAPGVLGRLRVHPRAVQRPDARTDRERLPAAGLRQLAVSQRLVRAALGELRPGDDDLPRVRPALGQHDAADVRGRTALRQQDALLADGRRRRAQVLQVRRLRPPRPARPGLQELG